MADRILIVEDEEEMRLILNKALTIQGFQVEEAGDGETALKRLQQASFDVVVLDVRLPGMSGLDALQQIKIFDPDLVVIIMTAFGSKELALQAMKSGAYDYFTKPFKLEEMGVVLRRALEKRQLQRELQALRERVRQQYTVSNMIGQSPGMGEVFRLIHKLAPTDATVFITGESGTGKELVAEAIHMQSPRRERPFIPLNCAAVPEGLLESELFGHEKGAFTGAVARKPGKFELADEGTLFLDEIGDMNFHLQAKILRILEKKNFERVGGTHTVQVNVRIIAATHRNLQQLVEQGTFREDLYYRLNVVSISLPPLRERYEDIPLLVDHLISDVNRRLNLHIKGVSQSTLDLFLNYPWPGNVRELRNCIERAAILSEGEVISPEVLPLHFQGLKDELAPEGAGKEPSSLDGQVEQFERRLIASALRQAEGVQSRAAQLLGIPERSLWYRIKKYQIETEAFKKPQNL